MDRITSYLPLPYSLLAYSLLPPPSSILYLLSYPLHSVLRCPYDSLLHLYSFFILNPISLLSPPSSLQLPSSLSHTPTSLLPPPSFLRPTPSSVLLRPPSSSLFHHPPLSLLHPQSLLYPLSSLLNPHFLMTPPYYILQPPSSLLPPPYFLLTTSSICFLRRPIRAVAILSSYFICSLSLPYLPQPHALVPTSPYPFSLT